MVLVKLVDYFDDLVEHLDGLFNIVIRNILGKFRDQLLSIHLELVRSLNRLLVLDIKLVGTKIGIIIGVIILHPPFLQYFELIVSSDLDLVMFSLVLDEFVAQVDVVIGIHMVNILYLEIDIVNVSKQFGLDMVRFTI